MKKKEKTELKSFISYRKVFRSAIWGLLLFLVLIGIVGIGRTFLFTSKINNLEYKLMAQIENLLEAQEQEESTFNMEGAKLFAKDFVKDCYTWDFGESKTQDRIKQISPYLMDVVGSQAGYSIDPVDYSSSVSDIEIWNMQQTGKNTCDVTLRFHQLLKEQREIDKTQEVAGDNGEIISETVKEMVIDDVGIYDRFVVIPLVTNYENYAVAQAPYFIAEPSAPVIEMEAKEETGTLINDVSTVREIEKFCTTFFRVMTTGTADELAYYVSKDSEVHNWFGIYEFVDMKNVRIFDHEGLIKVEAVAHMTDVLTNAEVSLPVVCMIEGTERYTVKELILK